MRSNYKKIGPYIRQVDVRNAEDKKENLLGVSTQKVFIDSIANTVGTDFRTYKIVKRRQFTYVADTSRRGDKIGIALLETHDEGLVSPIYTVFEITDENVLLPEYLMMWFRRPEFDRYARFKSHGSVRELFDWEEMYDVELPMPSIEKQREILKEYHTIVDRIRLNERLNQKLEETAQAIYKQWFVDFEFPISSEYAAAIGKPELESQPYKSSGGELVFNEVLKQQIPKGWEDTKLQCVARINAGGDKPRDTSLKKTDSCTVPIYSNSTENDGLFGYTSKAKVVDKCITVSARGGIGYTALRLKPFVPIVRLIVAIPKDKNWLNYLFLQIRSFNYDNDVASAQGQLTVPDISLFVTMQPKSNIVVKFQKVTTTIFENIESTKLQLIKLEELKAVILSKMAKMAV